MMIFLIKLLGGPFIIWLASVAGRKWGPAVSGLLGGLPLLAGCIVAALWLDLGMDYALDTARAAPSGLLANSAYMLVMAYASLYFPWYGMLACGWVAYLLVALFVASTGQSHTLEMSLIALASLLLGIWIIPKPQSPPHISKLPRSELFARMLTGFILVAGLSFASQLLGPSLTGIFAGGPVAAAVIPAFTLANGDRSAVLMQLRGFLTGLVGFNLCFLILPPLALKIGAWAVIPAGVCAVLTVYAVNYTIRFLSQARA
ncbi:hypothetical protein WJT86_06445 [Microvirga sp. W0021]|uniref:Uncharacterized protein n=1 Tax=Hohaiivirga grylli TaxID=3133970 RepID=A0ABV0BI94_9HYPH